VEQLAVGTSSDLVNWRWIQVDKDGTRNVFAAASLVEEGLVRAALAKLLRIGVGATIGEQTVLEEVPEVVVSVLDYRLRGVYGFAATYSSQALLPSWTPAWPM
jgi:hypothetical protein